MWPNSLSFRLITGAALWTAAAIVVAGLVLTSLYSRTVERTFDERLGVYLNTLVGQLALQEEGPLQSPGNLGEARFEQLYSGWYWQVDGDGIDIASQSLGFDNLVPDTIMTDENGVGRFAIAGPASESLRGLQRPVRLPDGREVEVLVTGNATELQAEIGTFRTSVILTLAVFGLGLVVSTFIQIRWGLRPLDRVRRGLADLRSGKRSRFEGKLPAEIEPLVRELNALLDSNQQIIERARTQVGNLAHALKTPLSVITNEARAAKGSLAEKVCEQATLMSRQITHYLDRARIAARSEVIGANTPAEPVITRLVRAMNRIHEDKRLAITAKVPDNANFRGEQQDLEEIVGNLADNACKWSRTVVAIEVTRTKAPAGQDCQLIIRIDDDGPGLTPEQRGEATRRGRRLDESKPGSGLGLSIVADLVGLYGGSFRLDTAPAGGLRAEVVLPAA
ncbi:MAG: histidine kinase [Bauldia sp.]|nr:histidine kinase [Bauldia sp.]